MYVISVDVLYLAAERAIGEVIDNVINSIIRLVRVIRFADIIVVRVEGDVAWDLDM